jgi:ABC-2 type transport system ATP-binding protein
MLALTVSHAGKTFQSKGKTITALNNASFDIKTGEIFGLLGPNGAGKTTIISAVCGLLELDQGTITVFNSNVATDRSRVIKRINLVTGFAGLLYGLSVEDLLHYYAMLYSIPNKREKIASVLKQTGLEDKRKQTATTLSSGFRQRFYIAKALLSDPDLLLMDEPTVGLDVETAQSIRELIKRLQKEGKTILLTTHYMGEAESLCDRIAIIYEGRIVAAGTVSELRKKAGLKKGSLEDIYLAITKKQWEGDFAAPRY